MTGTGGAPAPRRRGVVGVAVDAGRFLVIRRSEWVVAPGAYCFPGGGIDPGESETDALIRELEEELAFAARPLRRLWESMTPWQVELAWWLVECPAPQRLTANSAEVASIHWLTAAELRSMPGVLESNVCFLDAVARGEIDLR